MDKRIESTKYSTFPTMFAVRFTCGRYVDQSTEEYDLETEEYFGDYTIFANKDGFATWGEFLDECEIWASEFVNKLDCTAWPIFISITPAE